MKRDTNLYIKLAFKARPQMLISYQNISNHFYRPEGRDKYTRSKSPSNFNRKTIEVSTPAATTKSNAPAPKPQRARTASMPAENRKVSAGKVVTGLLMIIGSAGVLKTNYSFIINQWFC